MVCPVYLQLCGAVLSGVLGDQGKTIKCLPRYI